MRLIDRLIIVLVFTLCSSSNLIAKEDDLSKSYHEFKAQSEKSYLDFRDKANQEYADFLKFAWDWYEVAPALPKPKEKEKPPIVIEDNAPVVIEDNPIIINEEITIPEPDPQPVPIAPIKEQSKPLEKTLIVNIYGTDFNVRISDDMRFSLNGVSEDEVARGWQRLSTDEFNNLIRDCLEIRITKGLNDWAYLRMIDAVCSKFLGENTNEAELLKAYIYAQSGYQMRLATNNCKLYMLFGTKHQIYEMPYLPIENSYYYASREMPNNFQISKAAFPGEKPMSLYLTQLPVLTANLSKERAIKSNNVEWMKASVKEDINLMAYFDDYPTSQIDNNPLTRWAMYAQTPLSNNAKASLYPTLKEWIKELTKFEAVDYMCHWIQTGFVYEYDDKVWGGDRAFFADETLYYPYCDCEDRSILLTRIVRDILGLDCALVYYPGHLATAIALGEDARGDFIRIDGKKYIICDPTYINAPIGMTMPGMDNTAAKVIVLK